MSLTTLTADTTYLRAANEDVLVAYSDTALVALYKDVAKIDLKQDLRAGLGVGNETTDDLIIDDAIDNNEDIMKKALAFKQLCYVYLGNNEGEGSQGWLRFKHYQKQYADIISRMPKLRENSDTYFKVGDITIG